MPMSQGLHHCLGNNETISKLHHKQLLYSMTFEHRKCRNARGIHTKRKKVQASESLRMVGWANDDEEGKKEPVLSKGERRQTHMRPFSQSDKLRSMTYP